jgi:hypothetical protein
MKVIISESRFNSVFSKWLEKEDIDINIGWFGGGGISGGGINGYDEHIIRGFVTIREDGLPFGFQFSYKYEDNELTLYDIKPDIYRIGLGGGFKMFPMDLVIEYFSGLIKDYIYKKLETR